MDAATADGGQELLAEYRTASQWPATADADNQPQDEDIAPRQQLICVRRKNWLGVECDRNSRIVTTSMSHYLHRFHAEHGSMLQRGIAFLLRSMAALHRPPTRSADMVYLEKRKQSMGQAPRQLEDVKWRSRAASRPISIPSVVSLPITAEAIPLADCWHDKCPNALLESLSRQEIRRQDAIYELIATERDYVRDVEMLLRLFLLPLRKSRILSLKETEQLFSNLESLLPVNKALLRGMEERVGIDMYVAAVGDIVLKTVGYYKLYAFYCSNYANAQLFLQNHPSPAFQKFVEKQQADPELRRLSLGCYLIKPVQRICKYSLLFEAILNNTESSHPDSGHLREAIDQLAHVLSAVNAGASMAENIHRVVEVSHSFVVKLDIIEPTRRLVKEGAMNCLHTKSNGQVVAKPVHVFLLNDIIIIARKRHGKFHIVRLSQLENVLFISLANSPNLPCSDGTPADEQLADVHDTSGQSNPSTAGTRSWCEPSSGRPKCFQLLCDGRGKFTLVVDTAVEYIDWVECLRKYLAIAASKHSNSMATASLALHSGSVFRDSVYRRKNSMFLQSSAVRGAIAPVTGTTDRLIVPPAIVEESGLSSGNATKRHLLHAGDRRKIVYGAGTLTSGLTASATISLPPKSSTSEHTSTRRTSKAQTVLRQSLDHNV